MCRQMKIVGAKLNYKQYIIAAMAASVFSSTVASAGSFVERVYAANDIYIGDRVCDHVLRGDWRLMIDGKSISCTIGDCGEFFCEDHYYPMMGDNKTFDGVVLEGAQSNHWLFVVTETPEEQYPELISFIYSATCVNDLLYLDYLVGRTPKITQTFMIPEKP